MCALPETLDLFNLTLAQFAPKIASRLQSGLTPAEIEAQVASFTWTLYCANGTKLPPLRVTESFLSTHTQFSRLSDLIALLSAVFQPGIQSIASSQGKWMSEIDCELESTQLKKLYQQYKS
jgi:hypothetical protein